MTELNDPRDCLSCHVCTREGQAPEDTVVYRDNQWTVSTLDVPGWLMVDANRHSEDWLWGLLEDESQSLGPLLRRLSSSLREIWNPERIYLMAFGENSTHLHFLLISRTAGVPSDWRGAVLLQHRSDLVDRDVSLSVAKQVRDQLALTTRSL